MSAPIKCDQCGVVSTFAIQTPCVLKCGGTMYYDHSLKDEVAALTEERDRLREALLEIVRRADPVDDITRINRERLREEFAAHHAGPMVGIFEDLEWTTVRARAALSAPRPT